MEEAEIRRQEDTAGLARPTALELRAQLVEGSPDGGASDLSPAMSKAKWRRQNSDVVAQRRASRAVTMPAAKPHKDGHRFSWRRISRKGHAKGEARRRRETQEHSALELKGSKARWETPTSDWCREVLHLEMVAAMSSTCDADDGPVRRESAPDVLLCGDVAGQPPPCQPAPKTPPEPAPEAAGAVAGARAGILRERCCAEVYVRQSPRPASADAETQCNAEDMVELIWRSPLGQKQYVAKLNEGTKMGAPIPYSVAAHFSLFLDPSSLAKEASRLDDAQLGTLADRFLGTQIAGVVIEPKENRRPRLVPGRYVMEASLLAEQSPQFRRCLLMSSRRVLLGCARGGSPPLRGRSLLRLADEHAEKWARLAHTALNFACRLIQAGALPRALTAEIVEALGELSPLALVLGLSTVLGHVPGAAACPSACPPGQARAPHGSPPLGRSLAEAGRAATQPTPACAPAPPPLPRTQSSPAEFWVTRQHVGTSLRPHAADPLQWGRNERGAWVQEPWGVKTWVHYDAMITLPDERRKADIIPMEIAPWDIPQYWRCAAGGMHSPEELEARACRAEEALSIASSTSVEGSE